MYTFMHLPNPSTLVTRFSACNAGWPTKGCWSPSTISNLFFALFLIYCKFDCNEPSYTHNLSQPLLCPIRTLLNFCKNPLQCVSGGTVTLPTISILNVSGHQFKERVTIHASAESVINYLRRACSSCSISPTTPPVDVLLHTP